MRPASADLVASRFGVFRASFIIEAHDYADLDFDMQVRVRGEDETILLEANMDSGVTVTLDDTDTVVTVTYPSADMDLEVGVYSYDLRMTDGLGEPSYLVRGKFIVEASTTRENPPL